MLVDGVALMVAVAARNELAVRQLLAQLAVMPEEGYARGVVVKTLAIMGEGDREWVRGLY